MCVGFVEMNGNHCRAGLHNSLGCLLAQILNLKVPPKPRMRKIDKLMGNIYSYWIGVKKMCSL